MGAFSRGLRTSTASSGTASSTSPPNPSRSLIPAAASSSSLREGAWSSYPHPQCLSRRSGYQWTPFIRWAKATASVVGALSGACPPLPFAAWDSGNSL